MVLELSRLVKSMIGICCFLESFAGYEDQNMSWSSDPEQTLRYYWTPDPFKLNYVHECKFTQEG